MLITDQVATAACTDPIQVRFLLLRQSLCRFGKDRAQSIAWNWTASGDEIMGNLAPFCARSLSYRDDIC